MPWRAYQTSAALSKNAFWENANASSSVEGYCSIRWCSFRSRVSGELSYQSWLRVGWRNQGRNFHFIVSNSEPSSFSFSFAFT